MAICPRCAAHGPGPGAACPRCGERPPVAPRPEEVDRVTDAPAAPLAADPVDDDPAQLSPRLAWRLRVLEVRSMFSEHAVKLGFLIGATSFLAFGALFIILGLSGASLDAGCGCMLLVEAPLAGIACALAFGVVSTLWQFAYRSLLYVLDPKERQAARVLQQIEAGKMPGESVDDEPSNPPPDVGAGEGVTTPATSPDERVTQRSPGDVRREENPT